MPGENDLLELMHAVMHQVRSRQLRGVGDGSHDIAPMEGKVLGFFSRHPGATQSELVAHTGRDKGQIARLIAGLKDKGLLEAQADSQDGRVTRLHLSAQAQAMHLDVQRQRQKLSALAVAGMSAGQKQQLRELLQLMQNNLQQLP
ncbi:MarR family transcriptional regulator [Rhodoferax lacus]|uniref:MarR family transcriptional regulator n=1 Tax=Rhodoferax lacus TaxID=2184758 RepID=A0A3E1RCZ7_9BURK|nr:helix-turn-helix domain-containing protein [Rhodoferax lacus]RFO97244.1 MarR family transcriptional regulator [Rhodoferax lacus]